MGDREQALRIEETESARILVFAGAANFVQAQELHRSAERLLEKYVLVHWSGAESVTLAGLAERFPKVAAA